MTAVKDFIVHRLFSISTHNSTDRPNENNIVNSKTRSSFCTPTLRSLPFLFFVLFNLTVLFSAAVVHADDASQTLNEATIDFVKGYATVFPNGDSSVAVFAKRGMSIVEKDLIITGENGFVSLSFKTGTVVNIQPSSEVSLDEIDCASNDEHCHVVLNAISGNINSDVRHLKPNTVDFTITTPYASAAVRGTVFDIDITDGRLLTGVTDGLVSVNAASGRVELPENFGTKVESNKPPSPPKPLLRAPMFTPGLTRYDGTADLIWDGVTLAAQYLISLENTSGIVYRTLLADTLHTLQPLELGSYTAHLRAIDEDGFRGQIADTKFDMVKTDKTSVGPSLSASVSAGRYSVNVQPQTTSAELIELHFSPTSDFKKLINLDVAVDEVVSGDTADNIIYVRARSILSNTLVTPYGPTTKVPANK